MKKLLGAVSALAIASSMLLVGCSTNTAGGDSGKIKVVASTDVYADLVKQIGGDNVEVTSIVNSTGTDPHSYQANSTDRLNAKDAKLVVLNGGGYDLFLEEIAGQDNESQKVVNAVKTSGKLSDADYEHLVEDHKGGEHKHEHEAGEHKHAHEFNEHLWYDFGTVKKVSEQIANNLAELDSTHADQYRQNAQKLGAEIDNLDNSAKKINARGKKYIATEPVPEYLLSATGAENATPKEFAEAVEADNDVPALTLKETKDQVTEKKVSLVAYNSQTETSQTKEVLQAAKDSGVSNVSFTETLPENTGYVDWMKTNVSNLEKALA